jgi:exodeoxyribonuclease-3
MTLTVSTWNINSVRLRINMVQEFLQTHKPDVLCLQETKCADDHFPKKAFVEAGYPHLAIHGQKAYHGVAVASRFPLEVIDRKMFCDREDARHISVSVANGGEPVDIHNFYVPAGGDVPDTKTNWKFAHKLAFLDEMGDWLSAPKRKRTIIVGDLNIAPLETDVWSHKQLLKVVSHTPEETERLERIRKAGNWVDVMRTIVPPQERLFTWWSYRSPNWEVSDRGRRLDHVWASPDLAKKTRSLTVLKDARGWEKPSDHVPVIATFA